MRQILFLVSCQALYSIPIWFICRKELKLFAVFYLHNKLIMLFFVVLNRLSMKNRKLISSIILGGCIITALVYASIILKCEQPEKEPDHALAMSFAILLGVVISLFHNKR